MEDNKEYGSTSKILRRAMLLIKWQHVIIF